MGGDMTGDEFARLLGDFALSAESGDGARFANHFTEDAVYHDYIYGPHQGRPDIAHMMQNLFHRDATDYRWEMFDPVFDGRQGYAWSEKVFRRGTGWLKERPETHDYLARPKGSRAKRQ
jgi:ketosteroid isomerase-like protein